MVKIKNVFLIQMILALSTIPIHAQIDVDFLDRVGEDKKSSIESNDYNSDFASFPLKLKESDHDGLPVPSRIHGSLEQILLDGPLDSNSYILGTNDEFAIHIWGNVNKTFNVAVDNDGYVSIPKIGIVKVRYLSLADGEKRINEKLRKVYKKADISIVLTRAKLFKVHVLGEVRKPGVYKVTGLTRVSELIEMADGLKNRTRAIKIVNNFHSTRYADIELFSRDNNIEDNPYLHEGDRVYVSPRKEIISIEGCVNYPGVYDFVPGDNLGKVLKLAGGFSRGADSTSISVTRFLNDRDSLKKINISSSDTSFEMKPDDRVYVFAIPEYREHYEVEVQGEVNYPGKFFIRNRQESLKDIIKRAGGFTVDASLKNSRIYRYGEVPEADRELERLKHVPAENMSPTELTYLKSAMLENRSMMNVDFQSLFSSEKEDLVLVDKDLIIIRKKKSMVRVSGAVLNPGLIPVKKGEDSDYYISQAGGYLENAKRNAVRVMKNGEWKTKDAEDVESIGAGDMILVTEKVYRRPIDDAKDILVIISSVATILTGFVTLGNFLKK